MEKIVKKKILASIFLHIQGKGGFGPNGCNIASILPFLFHILTQPSLEQSDTSLMLVDCFQDDNLVFILHVLCKTTYC